MNNDKPVADALLSEYEILALRFIAAERLCAAGYTPRQAASVVTLTAAQRERLENNNPVSEPTGYRLTLSADQTWQWANNPGKRWPNSTIAGRSLDVTVDANGIADCQFDGDTLDIDRNELKAIVADHMPDNCRHLWPTWE